MPDVEKNMKFEGQNADMEDKKTSISFDRKN